MAINRMNNDEYGVFILLILIPEFGLMLLMYDEKDDKLFGLCLRNQKNGIYMEQSDKDLGRLPSWERPRRKEKKLRLCLQIICC